MIEDARAIAEELRRIAHGILPPLLPSEGLAAALRAEAVHSAIPSASSATSRPRASRASSSRCTSACLEAIQNATKHAGPGA